MTEIKDQNKDLEGKLKPFGDKIKKLEGEVKNLQSQRNWDKILLPAFVIMLIIWGAYGILKLIDFRD